MSALMLDDFSVPGHGLQVSLGVDFKTEDASGETSSTARASKGTKGKKLDVKLFIRFEDAQLLRDLTAVAEAKANGEGKLYTITNTTANAVGMREGRFSGSFKVDEQDKLNQWGISFSLEEHKSVPERAEKRTPKAGQTTQTNEGEQLGQMEGETPEPEPEAPKELNWMEKALKGFDGILAD